MVTVGNRFLGVSFFLKDITRVLVVLMVCCGNAPWVAAQADTAFANNYYKEKKKLQETVSVKRENIVFLGNSITERAPLSYLFPGLSVLNRGIGGDIVWGVSNRLDSILKGNPAMILLLIGVNDVGRGIPVDRIAIKYEQVISQIRRQSPSTRLVLQTVMPINERVIQYEYMKGKTGGIKALNQAIIRLGKAFHLTVVPVFEKMAEGDGMLPEELTMDGIHLTAKGYERWHSILCDENIL